MSPAPAIRIVKVLLPVFAIGLAVIYLLRTFDPESLGIAISGLDWALLSFAGIPLILLVFAIRTARWWWLLADHGARNTSLPRLYLAIGMSIGLGTITPAQSGEAFKLWLARRELKAGLAEATALHLLERVMDVIVLAALTSLALLASPEATFSVIGMAGLAGVGLLVAAALLGNRLSLPLPAPVRAGLSAIVSATDRPGRFLPLLLLTVAGWLIVAVLWGIAFIAAGVTVLPLSTLLAVMGLVTFATILSFVPGGVGVSEASAAALLIAAGSPPEVALAGAIALRVVGVLTAGTGGVFWLIREVSLRTPDA